MIDFRSLFRLDYMLRTMTNDPLREKLNVEFMVCEEFDRLNK